MVTFNEIQTRAISEWESLQKSNKPHISIGTATCGQAAGALAVIDAINTALANHNIEATITKVGCLGLCYTEPLVSISKPGQPDIYYRNLTPELASQVIEDYLVNNNPRSDLALGSVGNEIIEGVPKLYELPILKSQTRVTLKNCGITDPENIDHYIANNGYSGLAKTLTMTPEEVIEEIKKSGLRGRGGAGFPAGRKWESCLLASGNEKFVICNADEGDPGAFQDRSLLESDPHSLLEGMIIAGYAIGAGKGYIYVRAEYPLAVKHLQNAIEQAKEYKLLGENILGSDFSFELVIFQGAGAFVCGESTALTLSIEGNRGMPKSLPRPRTTEQGLYDKPTLLNNVKTFANASLIIANGWEWFASRGTDKCKGTAIFSLTGKVENCGLIEVPMGTPLREIIYTIGGGIADGKPFKAVQTGGPSGGCIPESLLDIPVDFDSLAAVGSIMGSGGMVVMDEDTCMVDVARYFLDFCQRESCGQCSLCRLGVLQMLNIVEAITEGEGKPEDIDLLVELGESIKKGSICGLGQSAPNPALTTIRYFRNEYEAHINEKKCPARVCRNLISYNILPDKCMACGICLRECPVGAITGAKKQVHVIDQDKCIRCGMCMSVCPQRFSAIECVSGKVMEVKNVG
jgi:NADH:ubiquinone oxidoreductase subunit F (NADH-binding)/(2Fe-2S) ferredoxin